MASNMNEATVPHGENRGIVKQLGSQTLFTTT